MSFTFDPVISDQTCPYCFRKNEAATAIDEEAAKQGISPEEGDISLCIGCAEIAVYTKEKTLRKVEENDLTDVDLLDIQKAQSIIKEFHDSYPETIQAPETHH